MTGNLDRGKVGTRICLLHRFVFMPSMFAVGNWGISSRVNLTVGSSAWTLIDMLFAFLFRTRISTPRNNWRCIDSCTAEVTNIFFALFWTFDVVFFCCNSSTSLLLLFVEVLWLHVFHVCLLYFCYTLCALVFSLSLYLRKNMSKHSNKLLLLLLLLMIFFIILFNLILFYRSYFNSN